jgi:hypothetical protein
MCTDVEMICEVCASTIDLTTQPETINCETSRPTTCPASHPFCQASFQNDDSLLTVSKKCSSLEECTPIRDTSDDQCKRVAKFFEVGEYSLLVDNATVSTNLHDAFLRLLTLVDGKCDVCCFGNLCNTDFTEGITNDQEENCAALSCHLQTLPFFALLLSLNSIR